MSKKHRAQLDLLDWQPVSVVPAFPEETVRAASLRDKIARAVAETLREASLSRAEIARRMSDFLGEEVSEHAINVYASRAREDRTISLLRMMALAHATGDLRIMQLAVEPLHHSIVPDRYLPAIEAELLRDKIEELQTRRDAAQRRWKGPRR